MCGTDRAVYTPGSVLFFSMKRLHTLFRRHLHRFPSLVSFGLVVAASLASTGKYRVRGLVRNLEKAKEALSSAGGGAGGDLEIELEQGDILDETSLGAAMKVI